MNLPLYDPRPLIIVDNNLLDDRGHHLALARTLAHEALAQNRRVHFYTHKDFRGTSLDERIEIHRVFRTSIYEVFAQKRTDVDLSPDFEAVFSQIARTHGPTGGVVLQHTCDAHVYRAMQRWIGSDAFRRAERLVFHLCTPYELKLLPGARAQATPVSQTIWQIVRDPASAKRIFFWGETERLAQYYASQFRVSAHTLPLPAPQWISNPAHAYRPPRNRLRVLFLGAARAEKGFLDLPVLAERIMQDPDLAKRVELRVQCSEPLAGYAPKVQAAVDQLATMPCCSLMHGPLSVEDYAAEFFRCDVVWVKYLPQNYFARGSAIVMEAFSAGKHALVSRGMFVDGMDDLGLSLPVSTVEDCLPHLRAMLGDLTARRKAARATGKVMCERYSAHSYIQRMLNRERFAGLLKNISMAPDMPCHPLIVDTSGGRRRFPIAAGPAR